MKNSLRTEVTMPGKKPRMSVRWKGLQTLLSKQIHKNPPRLPPLATCCSPAQNPVVSIAERPEVPEVSTCRMCSPKNNRELTWSTPLGWDRPLHKPVSSREGDHGTTLRLCCCVPNIRSSVFLTAHSRMTPLNNMMCFIPGYYF